MSRSLGWIAAAAVFSLPPAEAMAQAEQPVTVGEQDSEPMTAELASETARRFFSVVEDEEEEVDPCAGANADPDVIVVCRQFVDPAQYMFERPTRADSEVTGNGAPRARDPGGLMPDCETQSVCIGGLGSVPPPALMVDFEALPETPAGSDAARYGGPTSEVVERIGAESPEEEPEEDIDIGLETLRGIEDDTYGP